jgi:ATP-dependent DNA helicase RecQ
MRRKLEAMAAYCKGTTCRHRTLVNYFGQDLPDEPCGACDVCNGGVEVLSDALVVAQKILSSAIRTGESFGTTYNVRVLCGSQDKRILENGHERLSTFGILEDAGRISVRNWVEQLIAQGHLELSGEYQVLRVTDRGRHVLSGKETPNLLKESGKAPRKSKGGTAAPGSWEGVDRALFERLKDLRRDIATEKNLPAYMIFDDAALRDMARRKPASPREFLLVRGVGEKKAQEYAERFVEDIRLHHQGSTRKAR